MIHITMTAVKRPEIIEKTLQSFRDNLFRSYKAHNITLIVNVDPVGNISCSEKTLRDIFQAYFGENVVANFPEKPNFAKAFKWVWSQANSGVVFHLEDDWFLNKKLDFVELIGLMTDYDLTVLRLPFFHSGKTAMKNWNRFFPWNGKYYECPKELKGGLGFCGHPSFIDGEFVKKAVQHLEIDYNPEKQFHNRSGGPIMDLVFKSSFGVYGVPGEKPFIEDLGRTWIKDQPWQKKGTRAFFLEWEPKL